MYHSTFHVCTATYIYLTAKAEHQKKTPNQKRCITTATNPFENVRFVSFEEMRPMNHINLIIYLRMRTFDNSITCCMYLHVMCPLRCSRTGGSLGSDLVSAAQYRSGETSNKDKQKHSKHRGLVLRCFAAEGLTQCSNRDLKDNRVQTEVQQSSRIAAHLAKGSAALDASR